MDNPLSGLKIKGWYHVAIILGAIFLGISLTVDTKYLSNVVVQLVSFGFLLLGIGEWINHPNHPDSREFRPLGILFCVAGIAFVIRGIYIFLK